MKRLLAFIYWKFFAPTSTPYEYKMNEFEGKLPLRLSSTILPSEYSNNSINAELGYFSRKIIYD